MTNKHTPGPWAELPELWGDRLHGGKIALALEADAVEAALEAIAKARGQI
jgi:hypothetical protein